MKVANVWGGLKGIVFVLLVFYPFAVLGADTEPLTQVKASIEEVIGILSDDQLNQHEERRKRIIAVIDKRFDFQLMSQLALGKNVWSQLDDADRKHFVDLFSDLLKKSYIRRIEGYSDEKVFFDNQSIKEKVAQVQSRFVKNNDEMRVNYLLFHNNSDWLVYDVIIEGASIIKQYRSQFASIINDEQFAGLLSRLEEKIKIMDNT